MLLSCIVGNEGCSIFRARPIRGTKSWGFLVSAASILTRLFKCWGSPLMSTPKIVCLQETNYHVKNAAETKALVNTACQQHFRIIEYLYLTWLTNILIVTLLINEAVLVQPQTVNQLQLHHHHLFMLLVMLGSQHREVLVEVISSCLHQEELQQ